ncbi:plasmid stabilization system protein ParE [Prosthecobacter fusiformis]|uniref:Plasmid stabilization system protein ParE n=1 Tax=Prosthecobacter fusiformis TaxID=48464 RepID=A0A4R7S1F3_9BACT|nr:type II toxin-antitoxin system RelE/ParE family toxin [Prosthecobacter fusiformis]TDU71238.1 plasmid stabilization system protein ParE [Prosthecobacter fusiformis]
MKRPELIWTADGEADLRKLYNWMEEHSEQAGDHFIVVVDSALELLRSFPEMAPMYEPPFRRLLIGKRDIGLFYAVEGRRIVVHAIAFLNGDSSQIQRRLGLWS